MGFRSLAAALLWMTITLWAAPQAETDQFFAGAVVENTAEQLTVARVLQGKSESRVFRVTPETKVEGRLAPQARVTVRYVTEENGYRATLVIVRTDQEKGKK